MPLRVQPVDHDPFAPEGADVMPSFDERWNMRQADRNRWNMVQPVSAEIDPATSPLLQDITPEAPLGFFGKGLRIQSERLPEGSFTKATFNRLFGVGEPRHQTFPERMVRGAIGVVNEAAEGRNPFESKYGWTGTLPAYSDDVTYEPNMLGKMLGMTTPWQAPSSESGLAHVFDIAGLSGGAPLAAPRGAATLGAGMIRRGASEVPELIPAIKVGNKIYKGNKGEEHIDVAFNHGLGDPSLPLDDYLNTSTQPGATFGFVNHKGHFLNREKAGDYAVKEGLIDPSNHDLAGAGGLTADMLLSDTGKPGAAIAALSERARPFYSAVEQAVRGAKQGTMTPDQWRGYLSNLPGVKAEELNWVGMPDGPKITKQQMLDHVKENAVEVKEVEKRQGDASRREDAEDIAPGDAKFGPDVAPDLSLPGGENYREKLFTLPQRATLTQGQVNKLVGVADGKITRFENQLRQKYPDKDWRNNSSAVMTPDEVVKWRSLYSERNNIAEQSNKNRDQDFTGSHWDEPNVLAHVRMNDRVIPDDAGGVHYGFGDDPVKGLKTLHLEELQSDWHQAGRKQGYESERKASLQKVIDAEKKMNIASQRADGYGSGNPAENPDLIAAREAYRLEGNRHHQEFPGATVPDAPFKTSWPDMVLKRMVREASEKGYDAISWTPGEAQAARYDLSKHFTELNVRRRGDGEYQIQGKGHGQEPGFGHALGDGIPEAKLADYVGKDLAERIVNDKIGVGEAKPYSGLDLKVGGEGMKGFYDKILVDKANALAKKFGGKVEYKEIPQTHDASGNVPFESRDRAVDVLNRGGEIYVDAPRGGGEHLVRNVGELTELEGALSGPFRFVLGDKQPGIKVPVLRITPQMREHALTKGFSLFSDSGKPGAAVAALAEAGKAKPFYSAVEAAVRDAPGATMTPDQWRGYLTNRPGVRAEELNWVGVPEGKKITRQQMLDHIDEHGVQMKEVEKKGQYPDYELQQEIERDYERGRLTDEEYDAAMKDAEGAGEGGAKFSPENSPDLSLPGGENYREKLFTLPPRATLTQAQVNKLVGVADGKITRFENQLRQKYPGQDWRNNNTIITSDEVAKWRSLYDERNRAADQSNKNLDRDYQSSHWDEPNVLAHVRMNDRTLTEPGFVVQNLKSGNRSEVFSTRDEAVAALRKLPESVMADVREAPKALKTLHLEELQSDWHQAGRKQGYKGEPNLFKVSYLDNDGYRSWENFTSQAKAEEYLKTLKDKGLEDPKMEPKHDAVRDKGVPDAPFKTTWPDLVLKRMIREAAENGYDAVSWTPGEAQAARYDLSRQVQAIKASKNPDGTFVLDVVPHGDSRNGMGTRHIVTKEKLADTVGKELAEKILAQDGPKTYEGLNLKVGGEGMKKFYDKMLVDKANAIAKKFGGKVEWKELPGQLGSEDIFDRMTRRFHSDNPALDPRTDAFAAKFEDWSKSPEGRKAEAEIDGRHKIPVLRLTPQMRDTALRRGFPLFSAGVPFPLQPVDHDPFQEQKP